MNSSTIKGMYKVLLFDKGIKCRLAHREIHIVMDSSHDQLYLPLPGCQVSTSQQAPCLQSEKVKTVSSGLYFCY